MFHVDIKIETPKPTQEIICEIEKKYENRIPLTGEEVILWFEDQGEGQPEDWSPYNSKEEYIDFLREIYAIPQCCLGENP